MINRFTALLSALSGVLIGSPIAKYAPVSENAFDVGTTNVFYDLACLHGDTDGDGALSDSEYSSFSIDSLAPDSSKMENDSFRFLGFLPASNGRMFFYSWTKGSLQDSSTSYLLSYRDSVTPDSSGTGYINDALKYAQSTFVNQYVGTSGYFTKFRFDYNYPSQSTYRIKAEHFRAENNGSAFVDEEISRDGELFYDSSYATENAVALYFGKNTYSITGIIDGYLAVEDQSSSLFPNPYKGDDGIESASELSYFFFNFDDSSYSVDDIESVSYRGNKRTYTANIMSHGFYAANTYGTSESQGNSIFYTGTYQDLIDNPGNASQADRGGANNSKYADYKDFASDVSVESFSGTTKHGIGTVIQTDTKNYVLWKSVIRRQSSFDSIVKIADVDKNYSGDDYANFRSFIKAGDHTSYTWAYLVTDSVSGDAPYNKRTKLSHTLYESLDETKINFPYSYSVQQIYDTKTLCHDYEEVVTLFMHVVKDDQTYRINVINNPQSVRKYYLVGYPAPTLADIVGEKTREWWEDIADWFGNLWENNQKVFWILIAVACVVVLMIIWGFIVRLVRWAKGEPRYRNRK